jgi:ribosomal protein L37AE/L43A
MGLFDVKVKTTESKDWTRDIDYQNVPLLCPRCHITMKKIKRNGVTIDFCTKCRGLWLDDKEIDKLVNL